MSDRCTKKTACIVVCDSPSAPSPHSLPPPPTHPTTMPPKTFKSNNNNNKSLDVSFSWPAGVRGGPSGGVGEKEEKKLMDFSFCWPAGVRGGPGNGAVGKNKNKKSDGFLILLDGRCTRGTGWWNGWKKKKKVSDFSFYLTAGVRGPSVSFVFVFSTHITISRTPAVVVVWVENTNTKLTDFSFYLRAGVRGGPGGGVGEEWAEWRSHHQPSLARHAPAGHALHGRHGPHHAVSHPALWDLQVT